MDEVWTRRKKLIGDEGQHFGRSETYLDLIHPLGSFHNYSPNAFVRGWWKNPGNNQICYAFEFSKLKEIRSSTD